MYFKGDEMKKFIISIMIFISFLNAEIQIIASPLCKMESLSMYEIKNIFMLKKRSIENEQITILDNLNKETYNIFIKKYLNKSSRKMKVYWTRMLFTGKKIPPKKLSIEELKLLNTNSNCYLSYVEEDSKPESWSILNIK